MSGNTLDITARVRNAAFEARSLAESAVLAKSRAQLLLHYLKTTEDRLGPLNEMGQNLRTALGAIERGIDPQHLSDVATTILAKTQPPQKETHKP